jgi:alpha-tubulin suppressor-like RCC1 family protein
MRITRRPWRLAGLAGCAAMVIGMAAGGSSAARAQQALPLPNPNAAASWGVNFDSDLGDGTEVPRDIPGAVSGLTSGVLQVAAGDGYGLAITTGGTVWAWGENDHGELGDGTLIERTTPVQVAGLSGVRQVSAGSDHGLALRSDGTVWAWGQNDHGQVGNGVVSSTPQLTPVQVPGLAGITKVAAGYGFSLALRSDGTVWAWGVNNAGQLGNKTTSDSAFPVEVRVSQATSISAGGSSGYAIRTTTDGATLWAWGGNDSGQLGDGSLLSRPTPEPVTAAADVAQVAAGGKFVIELATNGSISGWGDDEFGQLGNTATQAPVTHPIETIAGGSGITQLSAGAIHVLALTSGGGVLAWGDNFDGELGDGNNTRIAGPVHVKGLSGASQVAAGQEFSLAVYNQPQTLP